jgi:hypothetical protein
VGIYLSQWESLSVKGNVSVGWRAKARSESEKRPTLNVPTIPWERIMSQQAKQTSYKSQNAIQ